MSDQSSFKRSTQDKRKNFTIVDNDWIRDKSISPKAKGILLYLLHLPEDWVIHHNQLQHALNIGEEYLNSGMSELIKSGYVKRTRKTNKGRFQSYDYEFSEFKIFLPDRVSRPGSSGPENPVILNTKRVNTKKEQQQAAPVAAAVSLKNENQKENMKPLQKHTEIYACLKHVDIPEAEKKWLTEKYSSKVIEHSIKWSNHPETKIKKSLVQALKWACENQPELPKTEDDRTAFNLSECKRIMPQWMIPNTIQVEILSKHIEFIFIGCQKQPTCIKYCEKDFVKSLKTNLINIGALHFNGNKETILELGLSIELLKKCEMN